MYGTTRSGKLARMKDQADSAYFHSYLRWDPDYATARTTSGTMIGRGPESSHVRFTPKGR
jgi:hypothetical protein